MSREQDEMIAAMRAMMKAGMRVAGKGGLVYGMGFIACPGEDMQAAQSMVRQIMGSPTGHDESQGRIIEGSCDVVPLKSGKLAMKARNDMKTCNIQAGGIPGKQTCSKR